MLELNQAQITIFQIIVLRISSTSIPKCQYRVNPPPPPPPRRGSYVADCPSQGQGDRRPLVTTGFMWESNFEKVMRTIDLFDSPELELAVKLSQTEFTASSIEDEEVIASTSWSRVSLGNISTSVAIWSDQSSLPSIAVFWSFSVLLFPSILEFDEWLSLETDWFEVGAVDFWLRPVSLNTERFRWYENCPKFSSDISAIRILLLQGLAVQFVENSRKNGPQNRS